MPQIRLVFYKDAEGIAPAYESLRALLSSGRRKEFAKCQVRIARLAEYGFELRRPEADYLRDGVYELRIRHRRVHLRILYFFHGQQEAVLSHIIAKEGRIPMREIDRALLHKSRFEADPEQHTLQA